MRAVGMMKCLELCRELKVPNGGGTAESICDKLWRNACVFFPLRRTKRCVMCSFMGVEMLGNACSRADYPTKLTGIP